MSNYGYCLDCGDMLISVEFAVGQCLRCYRADSERAEKSMERFMKELEDG